MKRNNGNITKIYVIPASKEVSKLLKNSTNGNTETKTSICKIAPSKSLSKTLEYGLKIDESKLSLH